MINERMKRRREELNYNQQEIADYVGITKQHVSFIENGKRKIYKLPTPQLKLWCDKLNLNFTEALEEVINLEEENNGESR